MSLILDLTPEEEERVREDAARLGLEERAYVRRLLGLGNTGRQVMGYGKFAHVPFSSEDLHRERQAEKAREERAA